MRFLFKGKRRPCKERASNCLPHNEHPFSYFTCVIALFGWSCHQIPLFRCTNMRDVGKSNQDAKIMTCYVHKHTLYTVDVPQTNFKSTWIMYGFWGPAGNHHRRLDSQWTAWWIQIVSVLDKWKWIRRQEHTDNGQKKKTEALDHTQTGQYTCGLQTCTKASVCAFEGKKHTHSNRQQLFSFWVIAMWTVWQTAERQGGANKTLMTI